MRGYSLEAQHTIIEDPEEEVSNHGEDREDTDRTASSYKDPLRKESCCSSEQTSVAQLMECAGQSRLKMAAKILENIKVPQEIFG